MTHVPALVFAALLAACASSQPLAEPATTPPSKPGGHTGFENTVWGLTSAELLAVYQAGTLAGHVILVVGDYHHKRANVVFALADDKLVAIDLAFQETYTSMDTCGVEWTRLRAHLDGDLGASSSDNLAAYWQNPSRDVTLSCEPGEPEGATLRMKFEPHRDGD